MAGRGRELTLPAWMKNRKPEEATGSAGAASASASASSSGAAAAGYGASTGFGRSHGNHSYGSAAPQLPPSAYGYGVPSPAVPNQFDDAPRATNGHEKSSRDDRKSERDGSRSSRSSHHRDKDRGDRDRERRHHRSSRRRSKDRSRSRDRSDRRDRDGDRKDRDRERRRSRRSRSRSHSRSHRDRDRGDRSERGQEQERERRRPRKRMFDVRPPGVTDENAAAYAAQAILQQNMAALSGAVGPASFGPPHSIAQQSFGGPSAQHSRHARRLYVGGIAEQTEMEITEFFNDVIERALGQRQEGGYVVSVYINRERHFAFVELKTIELTTACMNLDGITFNGQPVKVRRPNDYNPALVPKDLGPIPQLNLAALGIVSTTVQDGPGKVFIGGIPYHLNDEQVKELLQAFGPLRSFHLVKELNSNLSKGYGFCEYLDPSVTDAACVGLNGMKLGDKILTVRRAMSQESAKAISSAAGTVNSGLEMGLDPSQAALQAMTMAGLNMNIPSVPLGNPSRVLVLLNMVTPEELEDEEEYADILDDIKTECERFGKVQTILIPRTKDGQASAVGKVFVEFGEVAMAQAAANELHGRGFANRTVAAEFMDESKFERRDLQ